MNFLHRPGLVSALGCGSDETFAALFAPQSPLVAENIWLPTGKTLYTGRYRGEMLPFPADIAPIHRSRNNWLLWQALRQIRVQVEQAAHRYGRERIAVIIGTSTTGGDENRAAFAAHLQGTPFAESGYSAGKQWMSAPADFAAAAFGLRGIRYGISTACTSGARALMSAARLLDNGMADAVICGGADTLSYLTVNGFAMLEVLSPGLAAPFDRARDGINIGEAAAVFLMTREALDEEALPLLGYGASSDAWHMSSPHPQGLGAQLAMRRALEHARLQPQEIGWLNLHGTGTPQNDAMEALAVHAVLPDTPCMSSKPYTGHTLAAAGALEAALCWLAVSRRDNVGGRLPLQRHLHNYDPELPPIALIRTPDAAWNHTRRVALSASYAFGGNNCALILGEAP